jgi:lysophospholipase L1-like esterase
MSESDRPTSRLSRRDFVVAATGISAAGLAAVSSDAFAAEPSADATPLINRGDTVLLQGDSITDAGRRRDPAADVNQLPAMGSGYACLAAASLLVDRPDDDLKFYNRGISGHKVFQLADRWQEDCLDLQPNVLSILIGVNDIWHKLNGNYDGTVETYEKGFAALLQRTRQALPKATIVVCEPFVLKTGAVNDKWFPEFDQRRAAAKRVSDGAKAVWVPFQTMFDEAVKHEQPGYWAGDGVHPSMAGHALMAGTWVEAVGV